MSSIQKNLRSELLAAGATNAEVEELLPIAVSLEYLKADGYSARFNWVRPIKTIGLVLSGFAVGVALIMWSQSALPGSPLYAVQKASDNVAVMVHPQYRASVMMKRAQQVNQMVALHAGQTQILAALSDYTKQAGLYESGSHENYAAFEYCKANLQQAAASASPSVRQAIKASLQSLDDA